MEPATSLRARSFVAAPSTNHHRGAELIDDLIDDLIDGLIDDLIVDGVVEHDGSGHRENVRLTSVETAVTYLEDNRGDAPFGSG